MAANFEWEENKNEQNRQKHNVSFEDAQLAFIDPNRLIIKDDKHSTTEECWFCIGDIGSGIVTVRFTIRGTKIRIFGAGYWRKQRKKYYEHKGE